MQFRPLFFASLALCATTFGAQEAVPEPSKENPAVTLLLNHDEDPMQGFNRSMETVNSCLARHVVHPISKIYLAVLPEGLPRRISDFTDNVKFPVRAINNCLQGKWSCAWEETQRFCINTTAGALGFWDRATEKGYLRHDEDFGQTLAEWGVGEGCYLNMPVIGPSNFRDAPAKVVDILLNPARLVSIWFSVGLGTNDAMVAAPFLNVYFRTHKNTYPISRAIVQRARAAQLRDGAFPPVTSKPDESLAVLKLAAKDDLFYTKAHERSVKLTDAPAPIDYSLFMQEEFDGRIMFILPGLTSHRLDTDMVALAELYYNAGWSVAIVSSTFTGEFFNGTPQVLPGFIPQDIKHLDAALALIRDDIVKRAFFSKAKPVVAVMGVSLGGINAVRLACMDAAGKSALHPRRIIAVNPPRNPLAALRKLDACFDIPLSWPADTRMQKTEIAIERLAFAMMCPRDARELQLDYDESMFLIGLGMRLGMLNLVADIIDAGNRELIADIIRTDTFDHTLRDALSLSYADYAGKILLPYLKKSKQIPQDTTTETIGKRLSLDSAKEELATYQKLCILHSANDFLHDDGDAAWFQEAFGKRCIVFPAGSHLGALVTPQAQAVLVKAAN